MCDFLMKIFNYSGSPAPGAGVSGGGVGGFSPSSATGVSVTALALVPLGLVAISVFPPFDKPRTKPAVCVIFAEDPEVMSLNDDVTLMRTKRSLMKQLQESVRRNYRRPSVLSIAWQSLLGKVRTTGNAIKRVKDEAMCAKTRLRVMKMKLKDYFRKRHQKTHNNHLSKHHKKKKLQDKIMNSMDDCFDDMPEPMYGFKAKVTLADKSPCVFGSSCFPGKDSDLSKRISE